MLNASVNDRAHDRYYFIALDRDSGEPVGHAIVYDIRRSIFHSGCVGYGIYNRYWGQGLGRELLDAMIRIAFKDLQLHRLEAAIEPKNKRSLRLAKSAGMQREGLRREFVYIEGEWKNLAIFSILSEDIGIRFRMPVAPAS